MATTIFEGRGLTVTRFTGPAHESADRARWQFAARYRRGLPSLDRREATELCIALAESLGGAGYIVGPIEPADHSASRRTDVLEQEAPHLIDTGGL